MNQKTTQQIYPELPEWSKRDDLGGLVPSEVRQALRTYADETCAARGTAQATPTETHVIAITVAYEQGVGKGQQAHHTGSEIANPYDNAWNCDYAWNLGYKEGKLQAGQVIRCEENSSRAGAKTATPTTAVAVQPRQRLLRWGEQNHLPLAITSAPERIWLDLGFNPYEDDVHFSRLHDLTWSQNNATGDGIEYVRADLAAHNPLSL